MITGGQLELIVALVLGVDALVIAGIVISRLSSRRNGPRAAGETAPSVAMADAPLPAALEVGAPAPSASTELVSGYPEIPPSVAGPDAAESQVRPWPVEPEPPGSDRAPIAGRPAGLDFGPTWVDPTAMAATAGAEWRRALRRDLARAAQRGRAGLVMLLKLDIESTPGLSIQEVARLEGLLLDVINTLVRSSDYVDRTGPGRFHLILSEMPEAGALGVAERIKHEFMEDAPDGPRLLVGWAAMETENDIGLALQRAAERVYDGRQPTSDQEARTPPS